MFKVLFLLGICFSIFVTCTGDTVELLSSDDSLGGTGSTIGLPVTINGKIIDKMTRKGIGKAEVFVRVSNTWREAVTYSETDKDTAGFSQVGNFKIERLPANGSVSVMVKGPSSKSYVTYKGQVSTSNVSFAGGLVFQDIGEIELEMGLDVSMRVKDARTGATISMADESAIPIYRNGFNGSIEPDMALQDTEDTDKYTAVISSSDSTTYYISNLDIDEDGFIDYQGGSVTFNPLTNKQTDATFLLTPVPETITVEINVVDSLTGEYITRKDADGNDLPILIYNYSLTDSTWRSFLAIQDSEDTNKYLLKVPESDDGLEVYVPAFDADGDGTNDAPRSKLRGIRVLEHC